VVVGWRRSGKERERVGSSAYSMCVLLGPGLPLGR